MAQIVRTALTRFSLIIFQPPPIVAFKTFETSNIIINIMLVFAKQVFWLLVKRKMNNRVLSALKRVQNLFEPKFSCIVTHGFVMSLNSNKVKVILRM